MPVSKFLREKVGLVISTCFSIKWTRIQTVMWSEMKMETETKTEMEAETETEKEMENQTETHLEKAMDTERKRHTQRREQERA